MVDFWLYAMLVRGRLLEFGELKLQLMEIEGTLDVDMKGGGKFNYD